VFFFGKNNQVASFSTRFYEELTFIFRKNYHTALVNKGLTASVVPNLCTHNRLVDRGRASVGFSISLAARGFTNPIRQAQDASMSIQTMQAVAGYLARVLLSSFPRISGFAREGFSWS
jgi:hypothetical protein